MCGSVGYALPALLLSLYYDVLDHYMSMYNLLYFESKRENYDRSCRECSDRLDSNMNGNIDYVSDRGRVFAENFGWGGFLVVCFLYKINPNPRRIVCCGNKWLKCHFEHIFCLGWVVALGRGVQLTVYSRALDNDAGLGGNSQYQGEMGYMFGSDCYK